MKLVDMELIDAPNLMAQLARLGPEDVPLIRVCKPITSGPDALGIYDVLKTEYAKRNARIIVTGSHSIATLVAIAGLPKASRFIFDETTFKGHSFRPMVQDKYKDIKVTQSWVEDMEGRVETVLTTEYDMDRQSIVRWIRDGAYVMGRHVIRMGASAVGEAMFVLPEQAPPPPPAPVPEPTEEPAPTPAPPVPEDPPPVALPDSAPSMCTKCQGDAPDPGAPDEV